MLIFKRKRYIVVISTLQRCEQMKLNRMDILPHSMDKREYFRKNRKLRLSLALIQPIGFL